MTYEIGKISPDKPENKDLATDTFWPTVGTDAFYDTYNVPSGLPEGTVLEHLYTAIIQVNNSMDDYREECETAGYLILADVPASKIDEVSEKIRMYRRAVYCTAKSEILKESVSLDRKADAENIAKTGEETEDKYTEYAEKAMRLIRGKSLVEVAII